MKYNFKKFKSLLLLPVMGLTIASCLKDKGYEDGEYGVNIDEANSSYFVSIPFARNNSFGGNPLAIKKKAAKDTFELFQVNLEAKEPAKTDITVTLERDDAAVGQFLPGAVPLPASVVAPKSLTLTIPAGKRLSDDKFTLYFSSTLALDECGNYGLAYKITSNSANVPLTGNFNTVVYKVSIKNKFDGVYHVTGTLVDAASGGLNSYKPYWEAHLVTTSCSTVNVIDQSYTGGQYHPIFNGSSPSYYGEYGMSFIFDLATDKLVNVVSPYGTAAAPSTNNKRHAGIDPSGINMWDAGTLNISAKYFMYQDTYSTSGPRTVFTETFEFIQDRPK